MIENLHEHKDIVDSAEYVLKAVSKQELMAAINGMTPVEINEVAKIVINTEPQKVLDLAHILNNHQALSEITLRAKELKKLLDSSAKQVA